VIEYLGRSTHRVAISNHRLRTLENGRVSFSWKDDRHGGVEKVLSLEALECLRRVLLHVLPRGFVRIRHVGLLAHRHAQDKIAACRQLLHVDPATLLLPTPPSDWGSLSQQLTGTSLDQCPLCQQGHMVWQALPATELSLCNRSPPTSSLTSGVSCTPALSLLSSARPEENSGYTLVSRQLSPSGDGTLAPTTCSSSLLSPHHSRLGILACRPPHH
jgi:hypothetical protein